MFAKVVAGMLGLPTTSKHKTKTVKMQMTVTYQPKPPIMLISNSTQNKLQCYGIGLLLISMLNTLLKQKTDDIITAVGPFNSKCD